MLQNTEIKNIKNMQMVQKLQQEQQKCQIANMVRDFQKNLPAYERRELWAMIQLGYNLITGEESSFKKAYKAVFIEEIISE